MWQSMCWADPTLHEILGRPCQFPVVQNLLERFEETLAAVDYEGANPEHEHSQASPGLLLSDVWEPAAEGSYSGVQSQRSRLQDLVMATRSKAFTGCFGARMDRIGNSSGLGCPLHTLGNLNWFGVG
uniref:Uncharacterized protein n=1 Tax=Oncorhynchus mykiss TaxID=8022 RepID=A0A8C7VCI4_ONCMY